MATINKILLVICIASTIGVIYVFLNDDIQRKNTNLKTEEEILLISTTTENISEAKPETPIITEVDETNKFNSFEVGKEERIGKISLTPIKILEDSRCPVDAKCIQAGKVLVNVNVKDVLGTYSNIFIEGEPFTTETGIITLVNVEPKREAGVNIKNSDYRLTFEISEKDTVYKNASENKIIIESPTPNNILGQTFEIKGKAIGSWFFEASSRVRIIDNNGSVIFDGTAKPLGDSLTSDFVPFSSSVNITNNYSGKARIILANDNPSGMPENNWSISFPVTFK